MQAQPTTNQVRPLFGPSIAYRFGVPLWLNRAQGTVNGLRADGDGTSASNTMSAGIYAAWDNFIGTFAVNRTFAGFRSGAYQEDRVFDPESGQVTPGLSQTRIDQRITSISTELRLGTTAAEHLSLSGGLWGEFRLSESADYYIRRISPLEPGVVPFDSVVTPPGTTNSREVRFGPSIAVAYHLPITNSIELRPELALRLDGGALVDGLGFRALGLGAGVALLFDLSTDGGPPDTLPPVISRRDTLLDQPASAIRDSAEPSEEVRSSARELSASIDLFAVGPDGKARQTAVVHAELVRNIMRAPFPSTLYIDRTAGLDAGDSVTGRTGQTTFSIDDLAAAGPLNIHARAIDLLGIRMKEGAPDTITLMLANGPEGDTSARKVQGYLRKTWGINPGRVRIDTDRSATNGRQAGPLRIAVSTGKGKAIAPLVVEWRSLAYRLPQLDIRPLIRAEAGLRSWAIAVRQGMQVVTEYSSAGSGEEGSGTLYIPEARSGKPLLPLIAELAVEDSAGRTLVVYDTLSLALDAPRGNNRADTAVPDRERQIYHMQIEGPAPAALNEAVRDVIPGLRPGDRITTRGPLADRLCDAIRTVAPSRIRNLTFRVDDSFNRTPIRTEMDRIFTGWSTVVVERGVSRTISNDER